MKEHGPCGFFSCCDGNTGIIKGIDPFIQKLNVVKTPNYWNIKVNLEQLRDIRGYKNSRLNEIQKMCGCEIEIDDNIGDNCLRDLCLRGNELSLKNGLWLMNISI